MDRFKNVPEYNIKIRLGPSGIHCFNRRSGVNMLIDEFIPDSKNWSVAPRQVSIALTNACDLSCEHCYAPKNPAILPFDLLTEIVVELDHNGCIGVGFGGGEPTLHPRFKEICAFTKEETNLAVTLTTHGHHLSDQLLDELEGCIHFVRISMDGINETYESIRNRSFKELLSRIQALSKITTFGLNYVVNSKTIADLDNAIDIAFQLGATEFLLLPEQPVNGKGGIDKKTLKSFKSWVEKYQGNVKLAVSENCTEGLPISNPLLAESGLLSFAHIDANGFIKKTSYDSFGISVKKYGAIPAIKLLKKTEG